MDDFKNHKNLYNPTGNGTRFESRHCLAVNQGLFFKYGTNGSILRSVDSGQYLERAVVPTTNDLYHMNFVDSTFGVCVGDSGTVLKSNDAGATWLAVQSGMPTHVRTVYVKSRSTWVIGGTEGWVMVTTDGGLTWRDISLPQHTNTNDISNVVMIGTHDYVITCRDGAFRGRDLSGPTAIDNQPEEVRPPKLTISPNPATSTVEIRVDDHSPVLRIYDATGRLVNTFEVVESQIQINTSALPMGVYYVVSNTLSGVLVVHR